MQSAKCKKKTKKNKKIQQMRNAEMSSNANFQSPLDLAM